MFWHWGMAAGILGLGSRGTGTWQQGYYGLPQLLPAPRGRRERPSIFPQGVSNTSSLQRTCRALHSSCIFSILAACFKENPPHLATSHFSFSESDICKGVAAPVRALLLPGILQLIISPPPLRFQTQFNSFTHLHGRTNHWQALRCLALKISIQAHSCMRSESS